MGINELGDKVPPNVVDAARQYNCLEGVKYVYIDGKYPDSSPFPVASIGCKKATRFRSDNCENFKVSLADGWVAFKSPSAPDNLPNLEEGDRGGAKQKIEPDLATLLGNLMSAKKITVSPEIRFGYCGACQKKHPKKWFNFVNKSQGDSFYLCQAGGNIVVVVKTIGSNNKTDYRQLKPSEFIAQYKQLLKTGWLRKFCNWFKQRILNRCEVIITTTPPFFEVRYALWQPNKSVGQQQTIEED